MDVLLVEDDTIAQQSQRLILQGSGFRVSVAHNAERAMTLVHQQVFDLILMDIGLPEVDGILLTKKIQVDGGNVSTPIVALTGYLDKILHQTCLDIGMFDVLIKPITASLLDQLRDQLVKRG